MNNQLKEIIEDKFKPDTKGSKIPRYTTFLEGNSGDLPLSEAATDVLVAKDQDTISVYVEPLVTVPAVEGVAKEQILPASVEAAAGAKAEVAKEQILPASVAAAAGAAEAGASVAALTAAIVAAVEGAKAEVAKEQILPASVAAAGAKAGVAKEQILPASVAAAAAKDVQSDVTKEQTFTVSFETGPMVIGSMDVMGSGDPFKKSIESAFASAIAIAKGNKSSDQANAKFDANKDTKKARNKNLKTNEGYTKLLFTMGFIGLAFFTK